MGFYFDFLWRPNGAIEYFGRETLHTSHASQTQSYKSGKSEYLGNKFWIAHHLKETKSQEIGLHPYLEMNVSNGFALDAIGN